jgi:hypothetical protein
MEIDKTHAWIWVQNLHIVNCTITKEQLTKSNLGFEKNLQQVKSNIDLELVVNS